MTQKATPVTQKNAPATPPPAASKSATKKPRKTRTPDTRPADVIFAARFNEQARLMQRRFDAFQALGNAKKARPTPEQYLKVCDWLRHQVETTIEALGKRLEETAGKADAQEFRVLDMPPAGIREAAPPAASTPPPSGTA